MTDHPSTCTPDAAFYEMVVRYLDNQLDAEELSRFETRLAHDESSRNALLDVCLQVALIAESPSEWSLCEASDAATTDSTRQRAGETTDSLQETENSEPIFLSPNLPPVRFLDSTLHGTVGYFSSGWPVAYLVATVILGIGLVVGTLIHVSQPVQIAVQSPSTEKISPVPEAKIELVGRITGMVDCIWADPKIAPVNNAVPLGHKYELSSGLMEITYDTGAKVILQGPVAYVVESPASGFLSVGKLTAKLEKKAEGGGRRAEESNPQSLIPNPLLPTLHSPLFTIKTPTATITDLGTEFGVEVSEEGNTTSHVFRGSVELRPTSANRNKNTEAVTLHANESARVENNADNDGGNPTIELTSSAKPVEFVREIPKQTSKRIGQFDVIADWRFNGNDFLADSSGHGHTLVNRGVTQVDGTATFDGKAIMSTVDAIDLTPYKKVRVSWSQKTASVASDQIVWEHSSDYNYTTRPGAISMHVFKEAGLAGIRTLDDRKYYNADRYPVATNVWEHFAVEYDLTAYRAAVVRVFKDGTEIATIAHRDGFAPDSFINAIFYIGARDGLKDPFVGQIDNLKIEGVTVTPRDLHQGRGP